MHGTEISLVSGSWTSCDWGVSTRVGHGCSEVNNLRSRFLEADEIRVWVFTLAKVTYVRKYMQGM